MNGVWTTQQGERIAYRWMTSDHLIHAINLTWRKNGFDSTDWDRLRLNKNIGMMLQEADHRDLRDWQFNRDGIESYSQLCVPGIRENKVQLCMLRALLDVKPRTAPDLIKLYRADMDRYIKAVERHSRTNERDRDIWTLFVAHRVSHGA